MTQSEFSDFRKKAVKSGLSQSAYIRMLISGNMPKPIPPLEYNRLMQELYTVNVSLKRHGAKPVTKDGFNRILLMIQAAVLLPDRME